MPATTTALLSLEQALDAPHYAGATLGQWRWTVRQRMAVVRDALIDETDHPVDGWLVARGGAAIRERNTLLDRLTALGSPVLESAEVDTVVHLSVIATPMRVGGRSVTKEINVVGTLQLLAACQKAPSVRKVVMKSTTAVYGATPQDPAVFTEDMGWRSQPTTGYARDSVHVEEYARDFSRRRPEATVSILRFANFMGSEIETPLTRYFSMPVIPVTCCDASQSSSLIVER